MRPARQTAGPSNGRSSMGGAYSKQAEKVTAATAAAAAAGSQAASGSKRPRSADPPVGGRITRRVAADLKYAASVAGAASKPAAPKVSVPKKKGKQKN